WKIIQRFLDDENFRLLPVFFRVEGERSGLGKGSGSGPYLSRTTKEEDISLRIGIDKSFEDAGLIFLKTNLIKLTKINFKNELAIMSLAFESPSLDIMINMETLLFSFLPPIKKADEWNKLSVLIENSDRLRANLLYQIEQNAALFRNIHESITTAIHLQKVPNRLRHDTKEVISANSLIRFAQDTDLVQQSDEVINEWITEIRTFHRKSTRIRQIQENSGPLNEMMYWRTQVLQLNEIMNQLRLPRN
ncbi:unnamed protein product, partial [Didymodactylos carnosus]